MHMLHNKIHDTEALVHACSTWAIRGSKKTQICCSEKMSDRDIVRPPTPVQITPGLPTANRVLFLRCKKSGRVREKKVLVMTVMTSTPRSASHYRGNVVIVTALTTGALPSSCRNISGMQDAADLNFECHGKGCENLCTCDFSFICHFFNTFAKISNKLLSRCHYGVLFVEIWGKLLF